MFTDTPCMSVRINKMLTLSLDRGSRARRLLAGGAVHLGPAVLVGRAAGLPASQLLRLRADRQARLPATGHYQLLRRCPKQVR